MRLVQRFAYPQRFLRHKHVGLEIESSTLTDRQVIAGEVPWRTTVGGPVKHVSFLVDGKLRWTDRVAPYAYAGGKRLFDTFSLTNGKHVLEVRAYGAEVVDAPALHRPGAERAVHARARQPEGEAAGLGRRSGAGGLHGRRTRARPSLCRRQADRPRHVGAVPLQVGHAPHDRRAARRHARRPRARRTHRPLTRAGERRRTRSTAADGRSPIRSSTARPCPACSTGSCRRAAASRTSSSSSTERVRSTVAAAPYAYDWDTRQRGGGLAPAHRSCGRRSTAIVAQQTVTVTVAAPTGP